MVRARCWAAFGPKRDDQGRQAERHRIEGERPPWIDRDHHGSADDEAEHLTALVGHVPDGRAKHELVTGKHLREQSGAG